MLKFFLLFLCYKASCLPSNFSDIVELGIIVDDKYRGSLQIGLYGEESPKASLNFLSQCDNEFL